MNLTKDYRPRPPSVLDWVRTVLYYLYIAGATIVLGLWGLPQGLRITVGTDDQNRAVIDALSEFAAG